MTFKADIVGMTPRDLASADTVKQCRSCAVPIEQGDMCVACAKRIALELLPKPPSPDVTSGEVIQATIELPPSGRPHFVMYDKD